MGLSGYAAQVRYRADDLLDLLTADEADAIRDLFHQTGYDPLVNIPPPQAKAVFVFLGKAPTAQQQQFAKLTGQDRLLFWLRARYLALASANALEIAETAEVRAGGSYRGMMRAIAQACHPYPRLLTIDDLPGPSWD